MFRKLTFIRPDTSKQEFERDCHNNTLDSLCLNIIKSGIDFSSLACILYSIQKLQRNSKLREISLTEDLKLIRIKDIYILKRI